MPLGYRGVPSNVPLPPYPIPRAGLLRAPALPSGGLLAGVLFIFKNPLTGYPDDGDLINLEPDIQGPPGGFTLEWDNNASVTPGNTPLVFVGTESIDDLANIIISACMAALLPFAWTYSGITKQLSGALNQIPPPFGPDSVLNASTSGTGTTDWLTNLSLTSTPYNSGVGLAAVPLFPGAPRAVLVELPALIPPESPS